MGEPGGEPYADQGRKDFFEFETFELPSISWKTEKEGTSQANLRLGYEGNFYRLTGLRHESRTSRVDSYTVTREPVEAAREVLILLIRVDFHNSQENKTLSSTWSIWRQSAEGGTDELPGGFGRKMFDKIPALLQKMANDHGKTCRDEVTMGKISGTSREMSIQQWKDIFLPFFQKYKYKPINEQETIWQKTYEPNPQAY